MKIRFILFVMFAFLFSACVAPAPSSASQSVATTVSTAAPTLSPVQVEPSPAHENVPAMTTYTDELARFSLDYPAGWFVEDSVLVHAEESSNYSISISSWDILNPPPPSERQVNGLPNGGTKFDVTVIKEP